MTTDAPGQLLGYAIQFPRALFHLLNASPGDVVCVEVKADVLKSSEDGREVVEEDKSSINGNPLTNRSTNLWKTLFNWITSVNDGTLAIDKTWFILFANQSGDPGIVNAFHDATSEEEARQAVSIAKSQLADIDDQHDIWKYYDYVINKHEAILVKLIQRFELEIGEGAGYDNVQAALVKKHLPDQQIQDVQDRISGWLHRTLAERIAERQPARITWEEFDQQFKVLFDRARRLELLDFTLENPIASDAINRDRKTRPYYLKQLEAIECNEDDQITAVTDCLKAKVNRQKWIEDGIIDEDIAKDFQERLLRFWANQQRRIELTERQKDDAVRGMLLLLECKNRQETIRDVTPPAATIPGTYHSLADTLVLGWHPDWKNMFPQNGEA